MVRHLGFLLVGLVLLLPPTTACSLDGEPPPPAYVHVWTLESARERGVDIPGRELTGECGLGNSVDAQGDWLIWNSIHGGRTHHAFRMNLVDGERSPLGLPQDAFDLTLDGTTVHYRTGAGLAWFDWSSGTTGDSPLEVARGLVRQDGKHLLSWGGDDKILRLHDVTTGGLVGELNATRAGLGPWPDVRDLDAARVLLAQGDRVWIYDFERGRLRNVTLQPEVGRYVWGLDGTWLYYSDRDGGLHRQRPDGSSLERLQPPSDHSYGRVEDGHLIAAYYSKPGAEWPWYKQVPGLEVAPVASAVVFVAFAWWRFKPAG